MDSERTAMFMAFALKAIEREVSQVHHSVFMGDVRSRQAANPDLTTEEKVKLIAEAEGHYDGARDRARMIGRSCLFVADGMNDVLEEREREEQGR